MKDILVLIIVCSTLQKTKTGRSTK